MLIVDYIHLTSIASPHSSLGSCGYVTEDLLVSDAGAGHLEDDDVVDESVVGSRGGHGVLEDANLVAEGEVAGSDGGAHFIVQRAPPLLAHYRSTFPKSIGSRLIKRPPYLFAPILRSPSPAPRAPAPYGGAARSSGSTSSLTARATGSLDAEGAGPRVFVRPPVRAPRTCTRVALPRANRRDHALPPRLERRRDRPSLRGGAVSIAADQPRRWRRLTSRTLTMSKALS